MENRLYDVLIGDLEVNSIDIHLETTKDSLELILVKKREVLESDWDVVQFVSD